MVAVDIDALEKGDETGSRETQLRTEWKGDA